MTKFWFMHSNTIVFIITSYNDHNHNPNWLHSKLLSIINLHDCLVKSMDEEYFEYTSSVEYVNNYWKFTNTHSSSDRLLFQNIF